MEYPLNRMHHSLRLCQNIISTIQYYYAWLMDGWTNRLTIFCHFPHSHLIVTVSLWLTMMELFKKREGHCHEYQLVMVGFISYGLMTMRNVHGIFDLISKVGTLSCIIYFYFSIIVKSIFLCTTIQFLGIMLFYYLRKQVTAYNQHQYKITKM